jgi:translocation and assembly module TamB
LQGAVDFATRTNTAILQSTWSWWSNQIALSAQFPHEGILPQTAIARVQQFTVPAQSIRLPGYENIAGSLLAKWDNGRFAVDLNVKAKPLAKETNMPPVTIDTHATGDTNAAVIESAVISSPWLRAELSKRLTLHFQGELLREPATMKLAADLSQQPWARLAGDINGEVQFTPNGAKFPNATFAFSASEVGGYRIQAKTLTVKGSFHWPLLDITNLNAVLDDGSTIKLAGKVDLENQVVEGANAEINGRVAQRFLPAGYSYQDLTLTLNAQGPLNHLTHGGALEITNATLPQTRPLQLKLAWTGEDMNLNRAQISVAASNSTLLAVFSLATNQAPALTNVAVNLQKLSLQKKGQSVLELQKPATIVMGKGETNLWLLRIAGFDWRGPGGELGLESDLDWPGEGRAHITGGNLQSDLPQDFFKFRTEKFQIGKLDAAAGWTNGPLVFRVEVIGSGTIGAKAPEAPAENRHVRSPVVPERRLEELQPATQLGGPVALQMLVTGDQNGIAISNLVVNSETSTVAVVHGFLPATLNPNAQSNMLNVAVEKPFNLEMTTKPQSVLWKKLTELSGVVLREPNLNVNLAGTWREPTGEVRADVQEIHLPSTNQMLPRLEKLKINLQLSPQLATLNECKFLVQGQPVTASGKLPLEKNFWENIGKRKAPDWRDASARVRMEKAQISALQPLFPKYLSPQGELTFEARLIPGGNFEGELEVAGARTRPFPNVGPVRDIQLSAQLRDLVIRLEKASALVGGSAVRMSGEGDLRGTNWFKEDVPPFQFALRGTNVPISRQPDSVIRSDLNLAVTKTNGAPTLISGVVRMRDSFYLSDITDLVPGKVASPGKRPPYFSIEDEPFARWRLSLYVGGEKGMRVRSTIFRGQVTPNLRIQGTLKEPLALGDAKIDSGTVKFPFADFEVNQGLVTLSSDNPYRPTLLVSAASKRFGYDVKMDVTGFADAPVIQFSSTPPLSSEQLVLMVTAGELPKTGYTLSPQQRAQTAALFVGKDLLAKLGFGDSGEPRLTITSGAEISEEGKPTYNIEYKLTDRWALEGEYDRFNAYNAGLKWRVYSK